MICIIKKINARMALSRLIGLPSISMWTPFSGEIIPQHSHQKGDTQPDALLGQGRVSFYNSTVIDLMRLNNTSLRTVCSLTLLKNSLDVNRKKVSNRLSTYVLRFFTFSFPVCCVGIVTQRLTCVR